MAFWAKAKTCRSANVASTARWVTCLIDTEVSSRRLDEGLSVALRCARHVVVHLLIGLLDLLGDLAEALQEVLKCVMFSRSGVPGLDSGQYPPAALR